jgi:hypothetical protein
MATPPVWRRAHLGPPWFGRILVELGPLLGPLSESNPNASPETPIAPKSVHLRFVGSLEEGHFYASFRLRPMCRKPA